MAIKNGLSISKTNVLIGQVPTIVDAGVGEDASYISDPDHSLNYTCGSGTGAFQVCYGAQENISYVGVSGHNASTMGECKVNLCNGGTLIDSVTIKRNHNVMFTFPPMSFTDLKVTFITTPDTFQTTVSYIAAGEYLNIETGEQAGYKRAWLNRNTTSATTTNLVTAPVSTLKKSKALMGSLSFPNQAALFTESDWQDFIDFSFEQPFFVKEQSDKPESSYICFDPKHDIAAHGQTRELNATTLKFTCFNGL